jgi:hypothetical protein
MATDQVTFPVAPPPHPFADEQVTSSVVTPPLQPLASGQAPSTAAAPSPQLQAVQAWLGRLGLSGKILAIGALVGVIAVFLPLLTMSIGGGKFGVGKTSVSLPGVSHSVMVVTCWQGALCLVGYLAALALSVVLYMPKGLGQKSLGWAGVGVGAFITLLALWLVVQALNGSGGVMGLGQITIGFGAILNLLAGAAVATGGVLKAREERLF